MHLLRTLIVVTLTIASQAALAESCPSTPGLEKFYASGWGIDQGSQRYQTQTTINALNARQLKLKWSYGFSTQSPRVYPLVTEDTIIIGDGERGLLALDRETGCERWINADIKGVGTAISHGKVGDRIVLVLSGRQDGVYAVDAATGELLWSKYIDHDNPVPIFSGSPLVFEDQVFVPMSSLEIGLSANPFYGCCTTSGAMAALDLATGEMNWYWRTIQAEPEVTGRHFVFVEKRGPSGAPVWGAPTLDAKRRQLYFGTGQNYSRPATDTSDAIVALDIDSGEKVWVMQATEGDAFNMSCMDPDHPNCPKPMGPDVDFGAPPILAQTKDGKDIVLAGQKSGDLWGIDPDSGEVIWQRRIGRGGALGGIHWGMAIDPLQGTLFVPVSDVPALEGPDEPEPGMFALDITTGEPKWSAPRVQRCDERRCWSGLSAGIVAAAGVVVAGGLDGQLEVYDSVNGQLVWSYDTLVDFDAVNGVDTRGGSFDAHGPMLADNLLIAISGYGSFSQTPGNALLVFATPGAESSE